MHSEYYEDGHNTDLDNISNICENIFAAHNH